MDTLKTIRNRCLGKKKGNILADENNKHRDDKCDFLVRIGKKTRNWLSDATNHIAFIQYKNAFEVTITVLNDFENLSLYKFI